jgi:hypothetical protein
LASWRRSALITDYFHGIATPIHVILNSVKNLAQKLQRIPILLILSKKQNSSGAAAAQTSVGWGKYSGRSSTHPNQCPELMPCCCAPTDRCIHGVPMTNDERLKANDYKLKATD